MNKITQWQEIHVPHVPIHNFIWLLTKLQSWNIAYHKQDKFPMLSPCDHGCLLPQVPTLLNYNDLLSTIDNSTLFIHDVRKTI